jgi:peptidylprolyl isomerase
MRRYLLALPLLLAALALAACGSSSDKSDESAATPEATTTEAPTAAATESPTAAAGGTSGKAVKVTGKLGAKPKITVPGGDPPTKLVIKDIKKGTGPKATAGQTVTVQYEGVLWKDGSQFDASWDHGQPFSFPLGQGQVIPGWDQGVAGMRKGGRRVLTIPPDLAYGPNGAPPAIGPNETLVFVVDLQNITSP